MPRTVTKRSARTRATTTPMWRVLLHNDDLNTMDHVVRTLLRAVPSLTAREAEHIMFEAHAKGLALVTVCPLEPAEFYRDALRSGGLLATIEPA